MSERRKAEIELIRAEYGEIEVGPDLNWLIVKQWQLPSGWNKLATAVLVLVPPGYPITPPDNLYADNDLRLANEQLPSNTNLNYDHLGKQWLQFSYHVEPSDWKPHADLLKGHNLLTFLHGVGKRLAEAN
jgi:hypothetical protein